MAASEAGLLPEATFELPNKSARGKARQKQTEATEVEQRRELQGLKPFSFPGPYVAALRALG
jgi:hypothetical protein